MRQELKESKEKAVVSVATAELAEKERKFWETPASLEMTPERKAMQKILQELMDETGMSYKDLSTLRAMLYAQSLEAVPSVPELAFCQVRGLRTTYYSSNYFCLDQQLRQRRRNPFVRSN